MSISVALISPREEARALLLARQQPASAARFQVLLEKITARVVAQTLEFPALTKRLARVRSRVLAVNLREEKPVTNAVPAPRLAEVGVYDYFFVVVCLVVAGVYFSWVQFRGVIDRARQRNSTTVGEVAGQDPEASLRTDLEASTQGLKVSSPILGVIILVLSMAFFYLYLVFVYPIRDAW